MNRKPGVTKGLKGFRRHCGSVNALLQERLAQFSQEHRHVLRLRYGPPPHPRSMSIRRYDDHRLLARITSLIEPPEELREIDPSLNRALRSVGLVPDHDRLRIPQESTDDFVSRVLLALGTAVGLPSDDENHLRQGGDVSVWSLLESMTGTIEAPEDWSAQHDHYLYGLPKRNEDGGE